MNKQASRAMVALITGGIDRHYACAIAKALGSSGIALDVVGNSEMDSCGLRSLGNVRLLAFYAMPRPEQNLFLKLFSILAVYLRLICYAGTSSPRTFHVLWHYKIPYFDRTLLLLYYKALGKKVVFTAHNVNAAERDGVDSLLNRLTLRIQYHLVDHIFVHTEGMKKQLVTSFCVGPEKVTVIPFGVGDMVPQTSLTPAEAKQHLGFRDSHRVILFFGRIVGYKGIDLLVEAFGRIAPQDRNYRLIIAGELRKEAEEYWQDVRKTIESSSTREQVVQEIRYIADEEMEIYLKAADVLVLPYKQIFQSGVLFMSHNFGLPVIATDVGTFRDDIIEGTNGYVCRPNDAEDLASKIEGFFFSNLYKNLDERRAEIQSSVRSGHSWSAVARITSDIYARFSEQPWSEHGHRATRLTHVPLSSQSDAAKHHDS